MKLIFVCSGNTCRSPLAVAAWRLEMGEMDEKQRAQLARIRVSSAGLSARAGACATALAQRVAASWGADLSDHRARVWRPQSGVSVAMTGEQNAQLRFRLDMHPAPLDARVVTLGDFAPRQSSQTPAWAAGEEDADIPDPYGGSIEAYEECARRIRRGVRALARFYCLEL